MNARALAHFDFHTLTDTGVRRRHSIAAIAVLSVLYLSIAFGILAHTVRSSEGVLHFTEKDSAQYISIGQTFAAGDFSMSYVKNRPHRQPLYPFLLAIALDLGRGALFPLGAVNVLIGLATLLILYFGCLQIFSRNRLVAALVSLAFVTNPFVLEQVGKRLLTEPLHMLWTVLIVFTLVCHLRQRVRHGLYYLSALAALDYLTRPNGLFVMGALLVIVLWDEIRRAEPLAEGETKARRIGRSLTRYGLSLAIFAVIAAPSWIPRWHYFGDPVHHGYLSNYLYVDTYEEGHTGLPRAAFGWRDYAAHHSFYDFLQRWGHGFRRVWFAIPFGIAPPLHLLAMAGLLLIVIERNATFVLVALFALLQSLPLVWTNLSNPNQRVPYAAILPMEWLFAGFALLWIFQLIALGAGGDTGNAAISAEGD